MNSPGEHMHEIARRHGWTEHEVVILGHLDKATELTEGSPTITTKTWMVG